MPTVANPFGDKCPEEQGVSLSWPPQKNRLVRVVAGRKAVISDGSVGSEITIMLMPDELIASGRADLHQYDELAKIEEEYCAGCVRQLPAFKRQLRRVPMRVFNFWLYLIKIKRCILAIDKFASATFQVRYSP